MSDPEARPLPQYGEYATPEEQRARIRQPAVEPAAPAAPFAPPAPPARGRLADRIITFGLLGYGLITVLTTIPAVTDYGPFATALLRALGVDAALSDPASGRGWGIAAALVLGVGWLAAAAASWLNVRAGRISFWIPLAAGILCNLISSTLVLVPLMSDPAVWAALQRAAGG